MPFVSTAYLKYLETQLAGGGVGASEASPTPGVDLPPVGPEEPTTAPYGPPSQGGPGSYPAGGPPPNEGMVPMPIPGMLQTPNQWDQSGNFSGGVNYPVPIGMTPGYPNDQFPLPAGGGQPPFNNPSAGTESVPTTIPQNQLWPNDVPPPQVPPPVGPPPTPQAGGGAPPSPPQGGNLPGPPLINFGGLPPGFIEANRFGGGAPSFTPAGSVGPQWYPGGSIFGAHYIPGLSVPGTMNWAPGAPGGNLGTIGGDISWHMVRPEFGGLTLAQVAKIHPEWLQGLANMGAQAGGNFGAHAGASVASEGSHTNQQ